MLFGGICCARRVHRRSAWRVVKHHSRAIGLEKQSPQPIRYHSASGCTQYCSMLQSPWRARLHSAAANSPCAALTLAL